MAGIAEPVGASAGTVAVWRDEWLAPSETFIRAQTAALTRWRCQRVGYRRSANPLVEPDATVFGSAFTPKIDAVRARLSSRRVARHLRTWNPDVVHAHFGTDGVGLVRPLRSMPLPLLVTFHGWDATSLVTGTGLTQFRYRRSYPALFERASAILAVSDFIRLRLLALGAPSEKTLVHHIGVPIPGESASAPAEPQILFVGRLMPKKGVTDLLRAVAALPEPLRRVRVKIVGYGPEEPAARGLAAELGLRVEFAGPATPEDVHRAMLHSTLLCAPSQQAPDGDCEGLPTVVMEAAARGLPVVAYEHAGIPDAVEHGRTGLLAPERDHRALSAQLATLLQRPDTVRAMGAAGADLMRDRFDIVKQTAVLETIYDGVRISAGRPQRA